MIRNQRTGCGRRRDDEADEVDMFLFQWLSRGWARPAAEQRRSSLATLFALLVFWAKRLAAVRIRGVYIGGQQLHAGNNRYSKVQRTAGSPRWGRWGLVRGQACSLQRA